MRNFLKTVKNYFITLFKAIFNVKTQVIPEKKVEVDKLDQLDVDYIKELINRTRVDGSASYDEVQEQFKKNRRGINEYKEWYSRLVGYNKPPETLQKIIDADLKLDRSEMNKLYINLHNRDIEYFKKLDGEKNKMINNPCNKVTTIKYRDGLDLVDIIEAQEASNIREQESYTNLRKILTSSKYKMKKLNNE